MKERSWRYAGLVVTEQTAVEESEWYVELAGDENNGHWIPVGPDFAATLIGVLVHLADDHGATLRCCERVRP